MSTRPELPGASAAELHVLSEGYVGGRVASTVAAVIPPDEARPAEPRGSWSGKKGQLAMFSKSGEVKSLSRSSWISRSG
jgi:hypothetical protein